MTDARRAAVALAAVFLLFGVLIGTWLSRIPAVKDGLGLDNRALGLALLGWPLGSVTASLLVPRALARAGSKPFIAVTSITSAGALILPGLARGAGELAAAGFVFGVTTGALDIAANTHGNAVESAYGGSVFSRLHASWSAGAFIGAGIGAAAAATDVGVRTHFVAAAAGVAVLSAVAQRPLLPASADRTSGEDPASSRGWSMSYAVVALGIIALVGFVVEAAVGDWAAVYLHEDVGTSAAVGAAGYATFAAVHLVARAFGDQLLSHLGRRAVMQWGCVVAAGGYAVLLAVRNASVVFIGLAVIATGIAAVVPAAFGAAGRVDASSPAAGVATVTGISYVGWAAAPPLIGLLAGQFSLRSALLVPLVLAVVGAATARVLGLRVRLDGDARAHPPTPTPR